jgi:hypothetical protein
MMVRDNKSQAFLQVKAKEEFSHALRSAVVEDRGQRAEGMGHRAWSERVDMREP